MTTFWKHHNFSSLMHQSMSQSQPRAIVGHLPTLSVPGVGHLQISGICQPWGYSQAFKTHAVSYLNITTNTRAFYWKNKHTGLIVKDRKKLKRVVKTCSRFACIFPLLIKPESHGKIGSYQDMNQHFNFYWYPLFEDHPPIFMKQFNITYDFTIL